MTNLANIDGYGPDVVTVEEHLPTPELMDDTAYIDNFYSVGDCAHVLDAEAIWWVKSREWNAYHESEARDASRGSASVVTVEEHAPFLAAVYRTPRHTVPYLWRWHEVVTADTFAEGAKGYYDTMQRVCGSIWDGWPDAESEARDA